MHKSHDFLLANRENMSYYNSTTTWIRVLRDYDGK
nr:MAG TPA: hypothetical protein [Caudoviricetes sp.]